MDSDESNLLPFESIFKAEPEEFQKIVYEETPLPIIDDKKPVVECVLLPAIKAEPSIKDEPVIKTEPFVKQEIPCDQKLLEPTIPIKPPDDPGSSKVSLNSKPVVLQKRSVTPRAKVQTILDEREGFLVKTSARDGNEGQKASEAHTCSLCEKLFSNRNNLKRHLESVHSETQTFACNECPKFFSLRHNLQRHQESCHSGSKKLFCEICLKSFTWQNNLQRHIAIVHLKKTKMFCDMCPKFYFTKASMLNHMRIHGSVELSCDECPYKSVSKFLLDEHKRSHEKVECPICKAQVGSPSLRRHIKAHEKVQKCDECDKEFANWNLLRSHKLLQHYDGKVFKCHCGAVFRFAKNMWRHKQAHNKKTVKKPATCVVCLKQYSRRTNLWRHCKKTNHARPKVEVGPKKSKAVPQSSEESSSESEKEHLQSNAENIRSQPKRQTKANHKFC